MYIHDINPIALKLGWIEIHWYGLMYLLGFAIAWMLGLRRLKRLGWHPQQLSDLLFWIIVSVILGGRIGYVIFYNFAAFLADPLMLFRIWEGGMSFHGGLLGVMIAIWLFSRKYHYPVWDIMDFVAPLTAPGLGLGRLGNFIGGELWGRHSEVPWAVIFPQSGDLLPRHPSQLYQAALEGIVLFAILWWFSRKPRPRMMVSGLFILLYATIRFMVEFVREPDRHIGTVAFEWLTMGQLLSLPMFIAGGLLIGLARKAAV